MTKKVLLVYELEVFKIGFNLILKNEENFELVSYAKNVSEAMVCVEKLIPDIVIIDIQLNDYPGGFDLCKNIISKYPETKIIILNENDNAYFRMCANKCGASGYFNKNAVDSSTLIEFMKITCIM